MRVIRSRSQRFRYWRYGRERRLLLWLNISVLTVIATTFIISSLTKSSWAFMLPLVLLLFSGAILANLRGKVGLFQAGLEGEKAVTEALRAGLDDSFVLVNGLVLKGQSGDIDHVLVGPTGIFVIETKNYSGYVRCEGDTWVRKPSRSARRYKEISFHSPARAVLQDVEAVRQALSASHSAISTTPLIVFTNSTLVLSVKRPLIRVLRLDELLPTVQAPQPSVTVPEVDSIVSLLATQKTETDASRVAGGMTNWHKDTK